MQFFLKKRNAIARIEPSFPGVAELGNGPAEDPPACVDHGTPCAGQMLGCPMSDVRDEFPRICP
jgi:hypothetical protein